ncbi:unnamed protein product, partial [Amoebophrya sp. A120]
NTSCSSRFSNITTFDNNALFPEKQHLHTTSAND